MKWLGSFRPTESVKRILHLSRSSDARSFVFIPIIVLIHLKAQLFEVLLSESSRYW